MKTSEAWSLVGGLSKPSKMPGWAYGLPAKECKTGSKLVKIKGYKRLESINNPLWVGAMSLLINSKKSKWFRWHDSGDIQSEEHLLKIFAVCKLTPDVKHWMPTREAWTKHFLPLCPDNLIIRFSAPMVDQAAPASWPNTSTVVKTGASCPAPQQNNECRDCRACWSKDVKNVAYGQH